MPLTPYLQPLQQGLQRHSSRLLNGGAALSLSVWLAACAQLDQPADRLALADLLPSAPMASSAPLSSTGPARIPSVPVPAPAGQPRLTPHLSEATDEAFLLSVDTWNQADIQRREAEVKLVPPADLLGANSKNLRASLDVSIEPRSSDQQGLASWYGPGFHGRRTANGERFDSQGFTAAHRSYAFGTKVCVRSSVNGRTVVVRINDRGPFAHNRIIDLSQGAAEELGLLGIGIKPVEIWRLQDEEEDCPSLLSSGLLKTGVATKAVAAKAVNTKPKKAIVNKTKARKKVSRAKARVNVRSKPKARSKARVSVRAKQPRVQPKTRR